MCEGGHQNVSEMLKRAINECAAEAIDSFNWHHTVASVEELADDATKEMISKLNDANKKSELPELSMLNSEINRLMDNANLIKYELKNELKNEILDEVDEMLKEFKIELLMEMEARSGAAPVTKNKPKLSCVSKEVIGAGNILDFTADIRSALESESDTEINTESDTESNNSDTGSDTEYGADVDKSNSEMSNLMNNKIFNLINSSLNKSYEVSELDSEDEEWERLVKLKYNL